MVNGGTFTKLKLANTFYRLNFSNKSELTVNISRTFLDQIPIKKISLSEEKEIIELVDRILELNKELQRVNPKSDRGLKIQVEINRIDNQIDQKVYEIYGLTKEEIEIVEVS